MSQICTKACLDNLNPAGGVSQRSSCQWSCKSSIGEASTAFSPSRLLESDVCLADMLQLLSSGSPSAALSMDIDCMFVSTDHGTGMQGAPVRPTGEPGTVVVILTAALGRDYTCWRCVREPVVDVP
ncbi:hypothetical protein WJX79_011062 [Trebouxia sp. C0005]